jgi:putative ABC transport system permease protein
VVLSFGVAAIINKYVLPASVSIPIVIIALLISIMTGVVSGFIPAYRASKLNPIEALRYE